MRKFLSVLLVLLALLACADRLLVVGHTVPRQAVTAADHSMGVPETPSAPYALVAGAAFLGQPTAAQDYSIHAPWPVYWSAPVMVNVPEAPRTAPAPAPRRLFPLLI